MGRKFAGGLCIFLGTALILAALLLVLYNRQEDTQAGQASVAVLPDLQTVIQEKIVSAEPQDTRPSVLQPDLNFEMTVVDIDGHGYIGYLSIPTLDLELPVMDTWSYPKLRIAPCRQFGTTRGCNLVIAGHNYQQHFGRLKDLGDTDLILFTDMDGEVSCYQVGTVDVISPDSTEQVENSEWDLILYTCTYGGRTRVMVGARKLTPEEVEALIQ